MKTATKLRDVKGWTGTVALYALSEPLEGASYVFVSATTAAGYPETYIFPADGPEAERPTSYGELEGSERGTLSHADALDSAGYEIAGSCQICADRGTVHVPEDDDGGFAE